MARTVTQQYDGFSTCLGGFVPAYLEVGRLGRWTRRPRRRSWRKIGGKRLELAMSGLSPTLLGMNMTDWLRALEREIDRRVTAAIHRGALTSVDEAMECRTAPNGERVHFSIRGMLEDGNGSQDPGWMEPA